MSNVQDLENKINNIRIKGYKSLVSVNDLRKEIPQSARATETIMKGREEFINVLEGNDDRFVVITGPCSIHDTDAALEYAERILKLKSKVNDKILLVMRVYFEKPRTSLGWKGLINDPHLNGSNDISQGLRIARKLLLDIADLGVYSATELLDPIVAAFVGHLISWVAIGARTTESQTHRQMASGLSAPVGFKNATDGNLEVALNAMKSASAPHSFLSVDDKGICSIVETSGNPYGHLVLRGGAGRPNYHIEDIEVAEKMLEQGGFAKKILVDCSHENSGKDHKKQHLVIKDIIAQKKLGNKSIFGAMIESNINSGNQPFPPQDLSLLKYGVSITDECVSWEETEELVNYIYENI